SPEGRIGLYARSGNHEVVDIPHCKVLTPALAEVAFVLRELCANPPEGARGLLLPYNPFGGGVLRALDLREVRLSTPFTPAPQSTREPTTFQGAGTNGPGSRTGADARQAGLAGVPTPFAPTEPRHSGPVGITTPWAPSDLKRDPLAQRDGGASRSQR